jgi:hypothetical protein
MTYRFNVEVTITGNQNSAQAIIEVQQKIQKVLEEAYGRENVQSFPHPQGHEWKIEFFVNVPRVNIQKPTNACSS